MQPRQRCLLSRRPAGAAPRAHPEGRSLAAVQHFLRDFHKCGPAGGHVRAVARQRQAAHGRRCLGRVLGSQLACAGDALAALHHCLRGQIREGRRGASACRGELTDAPSAPGQGPSVPADSCPAFGFAHLRSLNIPLLLEPPLNEGVQIWMLLHPVGRGGRTGRWTVLAALRLARPFAHPTEGGQAEGSCSPIPGIGMRINDSHANRAALPRPAPPLPAPPHPTPQAPALQRARARWRDPSAGRSARAYPSLRASRGRGQQQQQQ